MMICLIRCDGIYIALRDAAIDKVKISGIIELGCAIVYMMAL
jgi:hypothetical protein